ncbi:MAG: hypothetical protein GX053_15325 [Tissierella sp.]|nr:hypothetical protein [Tissierella sp.]
MIGAIFNNWLMGVKNPVRYGDAFEMLVLGRAKSAEPNLDALQRKQFTLPDGRKINGAQVIQMADQFSVLNAGWAGGYGSKRIEQLGRRRIQDYNPLELSRNFGEYIEDISRLAGFIDQLVKTGDPYQAALQVKKYQFDYSELSAFERDVLKRVIPFYTWMRKNIPLQLEHLIRTPGVYTSLAHAVDEGAAYAGVDIEQMPDYLANQFAIPFHRSQEGIVSMTSPYALPSNDLMEAAQALRDPQEFGRFIGQNLFPWLRTPLEIATNQQFYSGVPIDVTAEQTGTSPSSEAILNYLFAQTGLPYNLYRSITGQRELIPISEDRAEDEFSTRAPAPFTPMGAIGAFQQYNPEYYQTQVFPYQYQGQLRREIQELTRRGETVYTTQELDQAEALGLHPEQVRIIHQLLEQAGMRKTRENVRDMYIRMQLQQGQ